jgi:uncharacterized protein
MALSLFDLCVPSYLQTLGAVSGFLDKALGHFQANGVSPEEVVETRLYPDMLPFRFQIQSVVHHSVGALEAVRNGVFRPPSDLPDHDYRTLQGIVSDARESIQGLSPDAVDPLESASLVFEFRDYRLPFTAPGFLTSFSLPNFYFHATTAYDILRSKGVPVGKRDYLGQLRLKK